MSCAKGVTRRDFIKRIGAGTLWVTNAHLPISLQAAIEPAQKPGVVRFGVIADVHYNFAPDAYERLIPFVQEMNERKVDFIIQLGDFCHGYTREEQPRFVTLIKLWNSFKGPNYHVLGNHELDRCSKKDMMDFWGMDRKYYSFDFAGYHFVVLDTNYIKSGERYVDYGKGNYFQANVPYLPSAELDWLKRDLAATDSHTLLLSHYGLYSASGVKNGAAVQSVVDEANKKARFQKVVACFCGHDHLDAVNTVNGIHDIRINSSSYYWLGGKWKWAPYRDSLYATVTLKPGLLEIEGKKSKFVGPHPYDRGFPREPHRNIVAEISDRRLPFPHRRSVEEADSRRCREAPSPFPRSHVTESDGFC